MKIFLTGGTGFIGKKFIKEATKLKHIIYAVTRKKKKSNEKNLKWLIGNIDSDWSEYLKKSDVLIHMAAAGVNNKISLKKAVEANVLKPYKLLINAINSNCTNWLIIGSASEYGRQAKYKKKLTSKTKEMPETTYERTKYLFSRLSISLSKKFKTKCRVMRLFNVYGEGENNERLWPSLKKAAEFNKDLKMTDGTEIRDFVSVNEVAKKILSASNFKKTNNRFPQIWHIASGKPITVRKFAQKKWKEFNAKGKLLFGRIEVISKNNYISEKKSIWGIK
jgi:nucleoside-diphosphate-sugar epimerase